MPVIHVPDSEEFQAILVKASRTTVVVVDFSAKWCGPCNTMAPIFDRLSNGYTKEQALFLKVDIEECSDVASEYSVQSIPTFVFLKGGQEIDRLRGADPSSLESKVAQLIGSSKPAFGSSSGTSGNRSVNGIARTNDEGLTGLLSAVLGSALPKHQNDANFSGVGHRLGDDNAESQRNEGAPGTGWLSGWFGSGGSQPATSVEKLNAEEAAQVKMEVDASLPVTTVRIRLADGSKVSVRLNLDHQVSKVRDFITTYRPDYASKPFIIMKTFPTSQINDETVSIKDAGIGHCQVVQKLT